MRSIGEILRRCYYDMVRRRSSVRVVQATAELQSEYAPIFIIGVYRSGTTLLRYILDGHSHICCPSESDFILPLSKVVTDVRSSTGLRYMGFDKPHVKAKARELIEYFFINYSKSVNKRRWADKTPGYIDCVDFISSVFPEAQFLMLYRHGLDQSHSMTRGGTFQRAVTESYCEQGEDLRVGATRYWNEKVSMMLDFEKRNPERCLRVGYEALCESPEVITRQIFSFLGEPFEPDTLNLSKFQHTIGAEDGRTAAAKKVTAASRHFQEWNPNLQSQCLKIAEHNLMKLGYETVARNQESAI